MRTKKYQRLIGNFFLGLCLGLSAIIFQTPHLHTSKCIYLSDEKDIAIHNNLRFLQSNKHERQERNDYEQNLNSNVNVDTNGKNYEDQKLTSGVIRPRYYSTELGMKDKLLVSVLSDISTIKTFGVAINKTLNHYVNKLIFFVDGTGPQKLNLDLPIVGFKESKPPLKLFRVISYIIEHHMHFYEYFLFVNDKSYVNGHYLLSLLQRISIHHSSHFGTNLKSEDKYCSTDAGILLSRDVLQKLKSELTWCIRHIQSSYVDVILHKCIMLTSHQPCSLLYKENFISVPQHLSSDEVLKNIENSIVVSNITKSSEIYQIHLSILKKLIAGNQNYVSNLQRKINITNAHSSWPFGSSPALWSSSRFDLLKWSIFNSTTLFMPNDFYTNKEIAEIDVIDLWAVTNSSLDHLFSKKKYAMYKFKKLSYGYRRFDPIRGIDYMLNIICMSPSGGAVPIRIHAFRGLTTAEVIPMPYVTEDKVLTILVNVYSHEVSAAVEFLGSIEKRLVVKHVSVMFYLLYEGGSYQIDPFQRLKEKISMFSEDHYPDASRAQWRNLTVVSKPLLVSLTDLALRKLDTDALVLIAKPTSQFDISFFGNVRMNTVQGWQVYSPIPFALYHPSVQKNSGSIARTDGRFDEFDYSFLSFYHSDYRAVRKLSSKHIPITRTAKDLNEISVKFPATLFSLFVKHSNLHMMRAVEPSVITTFVPIHCDSHSSAGCETRLVLSYGPRSFLSEIFLYYMKNGR